MFPDLGSNPVHLGIAFACSTYAAFVPVPNITAATTSLSIYLPPANVPTVSLTYKVSILSPNVGGLKKASERNLFHHLTVLAFYQQRKSSKNIASGILQRYCAKSWQLLTNAVTFISSPCLSMALLNSETTSSPT